MTGVSGEAGEDRTPFQSTGQGRTGSDGRTHTSARIVETPHAENEKKRGGGRCKSAPTQNHLVMWHATILKFSRGSCCCCSSLSRLYRCVVSFHR